MRIKISKKIKRIFKWVFIVSISYYLINAIYFGEGSFDERTGMCTFYWAGLDDLGSKNKASGLLINQQYPSFLNGEDGPYVFGGKVYVVTTDNELKEKSLDTSNLITVNTGLKEFPEFKVQLRSDYPIEKCNYELPVELIAISDIEGNLMGLYSILLANKVIDKKGDWMFGRGALVLNGDFFDRGSQVTQLLWFIYHLENQALKKGGKVHFILGNHEVRNLSGNASDGDFKYIEVAKRLSRETRWDKAIAYLYGEKSEIGKWLRSKNIAEKIGSNVFVHGGLNRFHLKGKYSLEEMNRIARKYLGKHASSDPSLSKRDEVIINTENSPYWDRRLNLNWKINWMYKFSGIEVEETSLNELEQILKFYGADKIIIGHSMVEDISTGYGGKVIKIDVKHGETLSSGDTKGVLIQGNNYYKIDDLGNKTLLLVN